MDFHFFMSKAYEQALLALRLNEVPIGAVVAFEGKIIGRGYNRRVTEKNVLCHAEIAAIYEACRFMGDWRLEGCALFVTVEPCAMCAGAILQARMDTVVFGAKNPKAGCVGSVMNLLDHDGFNHRVRIAENVMAEECGQLMRDFFRQFREKNEE